MHTQHSPKFKNKDGSLTQYALACGYNEQTANEGANLTLYRDGGPVLHVRLHDHDRYGRLFWKTFDTLTDARKFYRKQQRALRTGDPVDKRYTTGHEACGQQYTKPVARFCGNWIGVYETRHEAHMACLAHAAGKVIEKWFALHGRRYKVMATFTDDNAGRDLANLYMEKFDGALLATAEGRAIVVHKDDKGTPVA